MSIVGFACPVCKRREPLDHYDTTVCGMSLHPDYAAAVLRMNEDRYVSNAVEVTSGLGCPRSRAIESDAPVFINPLDYNALLIGRAWDAQLEKYAPVDSRKVQVQGELCGVLVHGEIDRVRRCTDGTASYLTIEDHKHGNNFARKFAVKEGVKLEHKLQASIYGYLYGKQFGEVPTHGAIWTHYSGAPTSEITSVLLPFVFLLLDITECLNAKPFGGSYTVAELYQQAASRYSGAITWEQLPLVGKTMAFGTKSFCDYCQVREVCFTQATGAPF